MSEKLYNGIEVEVSTIFDAGTINVKRIRMFMSKLTHHLSCGQPKESAIDEAEQLAVTIDAHFVVNGEVRRKSISGEYYTEGEKEG